MENIKQFTFNPFQENTYVVYDATGECVVVDCGCYTPNEQQVLVDFLTNNKLKPKYTINTHCHVDHVIGISFIKEKYGARSIAHGEDITMLQMLPQHALMFGLAIDSAPDIDIMVKDGDRIRFGNTELKVIHTPGHSRGGVCFYSQSGNFIITGDTLFEGSIGRTDLPGGNYNIILSSIKSKILPLGDAITVYPGHGNSTTIGKEKTSNPFLK